MARAKTPKRFETRSRARRTPTGPLPPTRRARGRPLVVIPAAVESLIIRLRNQGRGSRAIVAELARTGNGCYPRTTIRRRLAEIDGAKDPNNGSALEGEASTKRRTT